MLRANNLLLFWMCTLPFRRALLGGPVRNRRIAVIADATAADYPSTMISASRLPDAIGGVTIPRTMLALEAERFARDAMEPYLFNHSVRSFVFGAIALERLSLPFDTEAAFVAALFHDLGLIESFASAEARFELDGADAARTFLRERGVATDRAERVWLAIALHACGEIPVRLEPDVAMLAHGTATDVAGLNLHRIPEPRRDDILSALPRAGFKTAILAAFLAYARRKPRAQLFTISDAYVRAQTPDLVLPTLDEIIYAAPFAE